MEVVVGTYEELLLGYQLHRVSESEKYEFVQSFTDHSHIGCVKALAVSRRGVVASGSSDERIHLFNMVSRKELGSLMHHTGTVTSLHFYDSHMFSTSEDGTIVVWKTGKWEPLRTLRGHRGHVNDLAVHPTGKMVLSVGRDKKLFTWNLMTAKCAYITNLKLVADSVLWSPTGNKYIIVVNNTVDVYTVETGTVEVTIKSRTRISVARFLEDNIVVAGGEEGVVHLFDINTGQHLHEIDTKTNRVKALECCPCGKDGDGYFLITASSDGNLQMWHIQQSQECWESRLMAKHSCKFRPTCMTLVSERVEALKVKSEPTDISENVQATSAQEQEDASVSVSEEEPQTRVVPSKKSKKRTTADDEDRTSIPKKKNTPVKSLSPSKAKTTALKQKQRKKKAKIDKKHKSPV